MSYAPFRASGPTLTISGTTTSAGSTWAQSVAANSPVVRVVNAGTVVVFVRTGKGAQTATATDVAIPAGGAVVLLKGNDDGFAAICATGTASVYATPGYGGY